MNFSLHRIKFIVPLALAMAALPFSIPACHIALIVFGLVWIADGRWKEKLNGIRTNPIVLVFVFFFLLHVVGIIYSEDQKAAWFTIEKKISLLVLPLLLASIKLDQGEVKALLHLFLIVCLAATFICWGAAFHNAFLASPTLNFDSYSSTAFYSSNTETSKLWMFVSYIELASGIGMHPAFFSLYLIFSILILIHYYSGSFATLSPAKKIIILTILFYVVIFVLFLSSRMMNLALLAISLYGLSRFMKSAPRLIFRISLFSFLFIFCGLIYINPVSRYRSYQEISTTWPYLNPGLQTQSTTIRASLWWLSIQSVPKINLLLGVGTGDVEHLISETAESANITNVLGTNDPHNQYLQTLLGLGITGLCSLIICFAWPAWVAYQTGNHLYVAFIFLFSIICLTETAMAIQKGIVFYSLFGSMIFFQFKPFAAISFKTTSA